MFMIAATANLSRQPYFDGYRVYVSRMCRWYPKQEDHRVNEYVLMRNTI